MHAGAFLLVAMLVAGVHGIFDCTRDPNLCPVASPCHYPFFSCFCDALHEGRRCDIITAQKNLGVCVSNDPCMRGVCYDDGAGNALCSCPDDYIGPTCDDRRYAANCDHTNNRHTDITLKADIAAASTFVGRAYVDGQAGAPACYLLCTSAGVCTIAAIDFDDANCGPTTDDAISRTRKIVLEYFDGSTSARDELISIRCGLQSDTVDKSATVVVTFNSANLGQSEVDLVARDADISFTVNPVTNVLGDKVTATADLTAAGRLRFKQILVKRCTLSDGVIEHTVIENYCLEDFYLVAGATGVVRTGTRHAWTFEAIRIRDQDNLHVECTIRVCVVEADCASVGGCHRGDAGLGRKRRDLENVPPTSDTVVEKEVKARIRVLEKIAAANTENKQAAACYQNWQTTATIIALAVSLMLVFIVCMVLIFKTVLNRKRVLYGRDEASSTATLPHLPVHTPTTPNNQGFFYGQPDIFL